MPSSDRYRHCLSHSKFFYLLNISELSILKNVTANDLETSYILFLSQLSIYKERFDFECKVKSNF